MCFFLQDGLKALIRSRAGKFATLESKSRYLQRKIKPLAFYLDAGSSSKSEAICVIHVLAHQNMKLCSLSQHWLLRHSRFVFSHLLWWVIQGIDVGNTWLEVELLNIEIINVRKIMANIPAFAIMKQTIIWWKIVFLDVCI